MSRSSRRRGPVRRTRAGYVLDLSDEERAVIGRMLAELGELIRSKQLPTRLFPVAHPDDPEREAEYRRLMLEELVTSRLAAIDAVREVLEQPEPLDDGRMTAFMQTINALRLVLGDLLEVTDDPKTDEVQADQIDSAEHHLYQYLSWLLEWCVRAMSGR